MARSGESASTRSQLEGTDHDSILSWLNSPNFDRIGAILCINAVLFAIRDRVEYRTIMVELPSPTHGGQDDG